MKRLILATRNRGKIAEIKAALAGLPLHILSLADFDRQPEEVAEDAPTFAGNAARKAETVAGFYGEAALADDSGLEVSALGGEPGVRSARFAGPAADDEQNNRLLLARLAGVPAEMRRACFRCVIAVALPGEPTRLVEGSCPGLILESPRGTGGFGYDPLFLYEPAGKTFAEMDAAQKNAVSHRGEALRQVRKLLAELFVQE